MIIMNTDVGLFDVIANDTLEGRLTKGKEYRVYRMVFPKSYPKGLFLVRCDNGEYEIITPDFFDLIKDEREFNLTIYEPDAIINTSNERGQGNE